MLGSTIIEGLTEYGGAGEPGMINVGGVMVADPTVIPRGASQSSQALNIPGLGSERDVIRRTRGGGFSVRLPGQRVRQERTLAEARNRVRTFAERRGL